MASSSQAFLLLTLSMVLIPFSLAQAPMMAPSGSMSMLPRSSGGSSVPPSTMSPMPMMTPPPMPMAPPPMMPITPSTSPMVPSPSPLTLPDMASPSMPLESAPSPRPMPPAIASPDSGAFNVRNNVVALSCVVAVHFLLI